MKTFTESISLGDALSVMSSIAESIEYKLNETFSIFDYRIDPHKDVDIYFSFNHYPTDFKEIRQHLDLIDNSLGELEFKDYFTYEMDIEMKTEGNYFHAVVINFDYDKLSKTDFFKNLLASLQTGKKFNL